MKVIFISSIFLVLFALIFPVAAAWNAPSEATVPDAPAGDGPDELFFVPPENAATADSETSVKFLDGGEVREISVRDYLLGAVAAEMPASFEPEALKAQAVALRTYLMRKLLSPSSAHPEADICSDSSCCAAWKAENQLRETWGDDYDANISKIKAAVDGTDGMTLSYGGEPILAVFHSSSSGMTEDAAEVWGGGEPYLVSVKSPESADTVPNYISSVTVSAEEFKSSILAAHPEADFSGDIQAWITDPVLTGSGRLSSVKIGGVTVRGTELRSLFGLRSTAVELTTDASTVTMTSTGYGHGVGMSQYGAQIMAQDGAGFEEILANYYPGTELVK